MRTVTYWNRLPRNTVQSPSWEVFKTQPYQRLETWSDFTADQALSRRLDWRSPEWPSNLSYHVIQLLPTAGAIPYENEKWQQKAIRSWGDETEISESMKQVNSSSRGNTTLSHAPQQQLGLMWQDRKYQHFLILINYTLLAKSNCLEEAKGHQIISDLIQKNLSHFTTNGDLQQLGIEISFCLKMPY